MLARLPLLGRRLSAVCLAASLSLPAVAQCDFEWQSSLAISGTNNRIHAVASVPGQGLYAAGMFGVAGDVFANRVALWTGSEWQALGLGLDRTATSIVVEANGDIVVGGFFSTAGGSPANHLATWNGTSWSEFAGGANDVVTCLTRMPNGNLLAGGTFTSIGGQPASRVAMYDGTSWSQLGTGIDGGEVKAILVRPNGDIVVGGVFANAGGVATGPVAIWDGSTWSSPGILANARVSALANATNGDLLIGGTAMNGTANRVARWNGTSLQLFNPPGQSMEVRAIKAEPSGSLLVGLAIDLGIGSPGTLYRYENSGWTQLLSDPHVLCLSEHNGNLIAAGGFISSVANPTITEFNGTSFAALGGAMTAQLEHVVAAPDGGVFVAGDIDAIGNHIDPHIAHWDGTTWSALGAGLNGSVSAMVVTESGELLVSGDFTNAGGAPANHLASWNGSSWTAIGNGLSTPAWELESLRSGEVVGVFPTGPRARVLNGTVWTPLPAIPANFLSVVETANGDLAFSSGSDGVWIWDGSTWNQITSTYAWALEASPDGTLYFGHYGAYAWNSGVEQMLGSSFGRVADFLALPNGDVLATGFVGGFGQSLPRNIARWNGSNWVPVDGGTNAFLGVDMSVGEMAFTRAGKLCCIGDFASLGSVPTQGISLAVSTCPALADVFGAGCTGSAGSVSMSAKNLPWLGAAFEAETTGMAPMSLAVNAVGTASMIAPLPMGTPGCSLYLQPAELTLALPSGGTVATSFTIPATAALVGVSFRTQTIGVELDASSSITALTSSNALDLTIGAF